MKVAIKGFRMTATDGVDDINRFEAVSIQVDWTKRIAAHIVMQAILEHVRQLQTLDHQNIIPCLGVTYDFGLIASLVMPMCPEGNINEYVQKHPNVSKLGLVRRHPSFQ